MFASRSTLCARRNLDIFWSKSMQEFPLGDSEAYQSAKGSIKREQNEGAAMRSTTLANAFPTNVGYTANTGKCLNFIFFAARVEKPTNN
jgi:hypothetical protein